ncbi:MAG: proline racemase family protein [Steroidobacteraceae bacterium]
MSPSLRVIDSHTGGEPTRVVLEGGPALGEGPLEERRERFRAQFDAYRSAIVNEPRGSDPLVGALLVRPHRADCDLGVIFFNNVGFLGMCGHGTIGLVASLQFAGRLAPGAVRIDTPVGPVQARLHENGEVSVENVTSRRTARAVCVRAPDGLSVTGDVAWGGNWFFLVTRHEQRLDLDNLEGLTDFSRRVRAAVNAGGHREVDHVELFGSARAPAAQSRNFVLCPGNAYDRSPCGTGLSAKLACLAADGSLEEDQPWVQESIIGSTFEGRYRWSNRADGEIIPTIRGRAHVTGEGCLHLDPADPFCWGIRG